MSHDSSIHHRCSIRLPGYDYSQPGGYSVTIVTYNRECLFGDIAQDEMHLNQAGLVATSEWQFLERRFPGVELDEYIIMPNHVHGIIVLASSQQAVTLGSIVGAYKSTTARLINGLRKTIGAPVWQRNYYEHIIRNVDDLNNIRAYIQDNPRKWIEDTEFR